MHTKGSYKRYKYITYSVPKSAQLLKREAMHHLLLSNLLTIAKVHFSLDSTTPACDIIFTSILANTCFLARIVIPK